MTISVSNTTFQLNCSGTELLHPDGRRPFPIYWVGADLISSGGSQQSYNIPLSSYAPGYRSDITRVLQEYHSVFTQEMDTAKALELCLGSAEAIPCALLDGYRSDAQVKLPRYLAITLVRPRGVR